MTFKRGRPTKIEIQTITDNYKHKSYVDIAAMLNRDPLTIKKYIENTLGEITSLKEGVSVVQNNAIRQKKFWPILETQFTPPELEFFTDQWESILEQFGEDTLHTEQSQIIDLIKTDIMMNRNLNQQQELKNAEQTIMLTLARMRADEDAIEEEVARTERQAMAYSQGITNLGKEYRELQKQKNDLYNSLKATRSQRIAKNIDKKESFLAWITDLSEDHEKRREYGLFLEKHRLAVDLEEIRLGGNHMFEDGRIDRPLYNEKFNDGEDITSDIIITDTPTFVIPTDGEPRGMRDNDQTLDEFTK